MPLLFLLSLPALSLGQGKDKGLYQEKYRPQFHFTPARNWMNDPNGMVYHDGEYHLFYQHNPFGNQWGHMSWGHAVSSDMVEWKHLPVALKDENNIMIFSGSAVVDKNNTSGFGTKEDPPLIAIYTGHHTDKPRQDQRIAYSTDNGRTWTKYKGNPVVDEEMENFRDPKVFWHDSSDKWVMAVALPTEYKVRFYGSKNLKDWNFLSEFGPAGATGGIWECPDLFWLPVQGSGDNERKWVLQVDLNPGGPAGGSGAQYFVGEFDGTKFSQIKSEDDKAQKTGQNPEKPGTVLFDFENEKLNDWQKQGSAFDKSPSEGVLENQNPVTGFEGGFLINSFFKGDETTGELISPVFKLKKSWLNLLVGGGDNKSETFVELLVDGASVKRATGQDSEKLSWKSWDVSAWQGKEARLRIVDDHTGSWGHILVDHVMIADVKMPSAAQDANWVDYGSDFYAVQSWSNSRSERNEKRWLAWMSNWAYASKLPTNKWRSAMTFPRDIALRKYSGEYRLVQEPVTAIENYREKHHSIDPQTVSKGDKPLKDITGNLLEIKAEVELQDATEFGLKVRKSSYEETIVGYDTGKKEMYIDRTNSGYVEFDENFPAVHTAPLPAENGTIKLHILVDASMVEAFGNGGYSVISDRIFPDPGSSGLEFFTNGEVKIKNMDIWKLNSIWQDKK